MLSCKSTEHTRLFIECLDCKKSVSWWHYNCDIQSTLYVLAPTQLLTVSYIDESFLRFYEPTNKSVLLLCTLGKLLRCNDHKIMSAPGRDSYNTDKCDMCRTSWLQQWKNIKITPDCVLFLLIIRYHLHTRLCIAFVDN